MESIVAYHFLPARRPALIHRLLARLPPTHVTPVLDLEDSAADLLDTTRTAGMKNQARKYLRDFFTSGGAPHAPPLGVRVNAATTPYHEADLEAVADALHAGHELTVLLPKVASAEEVDKTAVFFAHRGLTPPRLFVIAETGPCIDNLRRILASTQPLVAGVVLGMIDYSLERGLWPFPGPLDPGLWSIARDVSAAAADAAATYVHPACLHLQDRPLIREIRRRLQSLSGGPAGMVSLGIDQTRALTASERDDPAEKIVDDVPHDPTAAALDVIARFREQASLKRSFSVDAATQRFIPPQEYLAAVRFLENTMVHA